jgi:exopolysaccharide biosynthesis polyprenyl glycosylphosphotransferase
MKTVTIGVIIIFLVTFDVNQDLNHPFSPSRMMILSFWILIVVCVGFGRMFVRTFHRVLLVRGIGRRRAIIVGFGKKARDLYDRVLQAPALGYDVIGFAVPRMTHSKTDHRGAPILCEIPEMFSVLREEAVEEVLIALPRRWEKWMQEVISQCDGTAVGIKIVPDLYDMLIGQVRTNQIYGFPLIEILPQLMPPWEVVVKRIGDILFSLFILLIFLPFWLFIVLLIRLDSKGPVFYIQRRVGRDGRQFSMIKFRSMVQGAEKMSGPVWATQNDPRVTSVGRFLRRLRLDEIPQFFNVLKGNMSLVGPRPERPFFVEKFKAAIPMYGRRLRIRPGITGWAQVKGEYDHTVEDVKEKLEYDLFYLENMSLRMDLKILLNTLYVMIRGKGH